jgi:hypothetical protein
MKIGSIVIRCYAFDKMLAFWQEALHYVPREPAKSGWVVFCDPEGTGPNLSLDRCPERGCVANTAIQTGQSYFVLFETLYLWTFQRCRTQLKKTGGSWRVDETYICIAGQWRYVYRAVDLLGDTIDFYLSEKRMPERPSSSFVKLNSMHSDARS